MTKQTRRRFILGSAAGAVCAPYVTTAHAQAWPTKPIRIVCAYPAGGLTDIFARAYGEYLQQKLGQPVTVENRSGASGSLGARAVKAAEPDGYTLMFTIATALLQNRVLLKNPGYDGDNDFVRIAHMSAGHLPTIAAKATGIRSIADLVAYAKQRDVSFGTFGPGSSAHITAGVLNKLSGLTMKAVHYRGEAPMWQDIAAGSIQAACGSYAAAQSVIAGDLGVPIAVPTLKRMRKLPDVPTFHEQGAADPAFEVSGFVGLVGPAGMPKEIVNRLSDLMVEAGKSARVQTINDTFGIDEAAVSKAEFDQIYAKNGPILIQLVRDLNLAQMDVQ